MPDRALSFGHVAQAYERFRLGYPAEVCDVVVAFAGGPIHSALEIGAGTGKATRLFAERAVTVTASDPDQAMLDELSKYVPTNVRTVHAAFEDLAADEPYDLVYAAARCTGPSPETDGHGWLA